MLYGSGDFTYELVEGWAKLPKGWSFEDVCGIAIDPKDRVYLFTRGLHPVMIFDREGNLLKAWGEELFGNVGGRTHGICVGPDFSVYCTDDGKHTVSKFSMDGKLILKLGREDYPSDTGYVKRNGDALSALSIKRGGPPFNRPTGVALGSSGEIYVSDGYGNARMHKFSPDGTLLLSWGEPGYAPGQFRIPHCVWVDKQDHVWVPDRENSRIQIFDREGAFLSQWTDLTRPTDLFIDEEGTVYVSEITARVSIFNKDGQLLARWGSGWFGLTDETDKEKALFLNPHAIAVDSQGDLYVGDVCKSVLGVDRGDRVMLKFVKRR